VTANEGTPAAQDLISAFARLTAEFAAEVGSLSTEQDMRAAQARYLGKKGRATELMKALGRPCRLGYSPWPALIWPRTRSGRWT
jgi:hypothetical protein